MRSERSPDKLATEKEPATETEEEEEHNRLMARLQELQDEEEASSHVLDDEEVNSGPAQMRAVRDSTGDDICIVQGFWS